jgi:S1-C subfamily serine protease
MFKKLFASCTKASLTEIAFGTSRDYSLFCKARLSGQGGIRATLVLLLSLSFSLALHGQIWAGNDVCGSVVKILATQRLPDMFKPWTKQAPREVSASGVVIEGNRILTNAHVVAFARQIYVQPYQSAEKIAARVLATAPGIDLAVLELKDESFFHKHPPLPFASHLPKRKDTVNVYGYPVGGKEQSITEGIVSRLEFTKMNYNVLGLRIQIDAALNPGNSGGPAVSDDKIIGLVFSKIMKAENIGYHIPVEEIRMFLDDIADGTYEGKPAIHDVEVGLQTVENDALRDRLGIEKGTSGIMVSRVRNLYPGFPLKPWDLITHLGEHAIDSEGHVRVHDDLRLPMHYLVPHLVNDGKVEMTLIRDGQPRKLQVPVSPACQRLIRFNNHKYPRYFIYGPLVFSPVTLSLVISLRPPMRHVLMATGSPIITRMADVIAFEGEELVALVSPIFPHRITKAYDLGSLSVVSHVNDVPIKNLTHLVETLRDAKGEFVTFRFANLNAERLVFRRQEVEAATEEILGDNGIRHQCSEDLRSIWREPENN